LNKTIEFSKCRSEHLRGPNRRILGQGIGQNLDRTIVKKSKKNMMFQHVGKNTRKMFEDFLYSKLPINRPWRPITGKVKWGVLFCA